MQDLQQIFDRLQENKIKMKDLRSSYKEGLQNSQQYVEASDELKAARDKVKEIQHTIKEQYANEFIQMEDLKIDIASDEELISDIVMTQIMKGENVEVKDKYESEYEPVFKVRFKKVK